MRDSRLYGDNGVGSSDWAGDAELPKAASYILVLAIGRWWEDGPNRRGGLRSVIG